MVAQWDSGARGRGFETYRHRVVSLNKTVYSPKVLVIDMFNSLLLMSLSLTSKLPIGKLF